MPVNSKTVTIRTEYSDVYKEKCFLAWYRLGRPKVPAFRSELPVDELGRKAPDEKIWQWIEKENWEQRADVLDAEVSHQIEVQAVNERVEMLNRQATIATDIQQKGMDYLNEHGFEKAADALRAVIQGAELERASRGLPTALVNVSKMENSKLQDVVQKLMSRVSPEEAKKLDADVIEGESEEIDAEQ